MRKTSTRQIGIATRLSRAIPDDPPRWRVTPEPQTPLALFVAARCPGPGYVFSARAYEHSVQYYLHFLGDEYGMQIKKAHSIREAVENYIQIGVAGGLFRDANFFELADVNPFHLEITIHDCVYLKSCQALIEEGFSVRDLTCARIGCFRLRSWPWRTSIANTRSRRSTSTATARVSSKGT